MALGRVYDQMNVTFTTYDAPGFVGGPNSWLRRLVPFLQHGGWQVNVLFFIEHGAPEDCPCYRALTEQGVNCRAMSSNASMFLQVRWLLQQLADSPPSVFVVNLSMAGYLAARWIRRAGIPAIGILHSDDAMYEKIFEEFVLGPAGNCVSDIVCVSDFLARGARAARTETTVHLIPYGVPVPDRCAVPPRATVRLIYVGRLVEEQKQILGVTVALCRVVREVSGTEAIIYGSGPDRSRVIRCLEEENVGDAVRLGGLIDNSHIQEVMLDAHILVLLSGYEGLPIALLEAMACGVVPVCLRIRSGVGQLIDQGKTGFLVDDRGDGFVATIRTIASDPDLWSRVSRAARNRIASRYSDELNATRWLKLLDDRSAESAKSGISQRSLLRGISTLDFLSATLAEHNDRVMKAR
jgi:glycosyltransferase involved in cell wall biosynthesis